MLAQLEDFRIKSDANQRISLINSVLADLKSSYRYVFFVDGSVTESGMAGAAVMCPDLKLELFYKLPNGLSIYYVEAYAILKALKFVTDCLYQNFVIISDSSCVLQDIKSSIHITSPHPFIITQICHELTKFNRGQSSLKWMPGEKKT